MNILFGQNLKGFADLLRGKVNDPIVLAYNVVGIVVIAFFCGLGAWGARRALRSLEAHQREQRALAEAEAAALAAAVEAKEAALSGGGGAVVEIKASGGGSTVRVVVSDGAEGEQQEAAAAAAAPSPALLPRLSRGSEGGPLGQR